MTYPAPAELPKLKGRLALWIGAITMIAGVVLGIALVVSGAFGLRDTVQSYQRVPISGGAVRLDEPGRYRVVFEMPGMSSSDNEVPEGSLQVVGPTGALPVSYTTSDVTYSFSGHDGRGLATFRAPVAGRYIVRYLRTDGLTVGELAVGRDDLSGFAKVGLGLGVGGLLFLVGLVLLIVGAVRRSGSKRDRARAQGLAPAWGAAQMPGAWAPPGDTAGWTPPANTPVGWAPPPAPPGAWTPPAGPPPGAWAPPTGPPPAPGPPAGFAPPSGPPSAGWPAPPAAEPNAGPAWASPPGPSPAWPPVPPEPPTAPLADGASAIDPTVPDPWTPRPAASEGGEEAGPTP